MSFCHYKGLGITFDYYQDVRNGKPGKASPKADPQRSPATDKKYNV